MDLETLKCIATCARSTANETFNLAVSDALSQLADRLDNVSSEEIVHERNGVPIRTGTINNQSGGATTAAS